MEDYWGIIYAIMKSLGINEIEIEDKYLEITPNDIYSMVFKKDIATNKTKVILNDSDKALGPIIKSIVTKEQFKSMEYKIEEK